MGVGVRDRLTTVRGSRLPRPVRNPAVETVIRAAPQWKNWEVKWEAAKRKKDEADKELKKIEESTAEDDRKWDVVEPKEQRVGAGRGARRPGPGRGAGRGARRPGRPIFGVRQTDVRLGEPGVRVVRDVE